MTYRRPQPSKAMAPCGECPKGKCDRCEWCRSFARFLPTTARAEARVRHWNEARPWDDPRKATLEGV